MKSITRTNIKKRMTFEEGTIVRSIILFMKFETSSKSSKSYLEISCLLTFEKQSNDDNADVQQQQQQQINDDNNDWTTRMTCHCHPWALM